MLDTTDMQLARSVTDEVGRAVLGKEEEIREVFLAFLASGHVLLTDIPGVGKTTMATAFSKAMDLESRRVQFTPDLMPSDLTGFSIYRREEGKFVYQPGSVFTNLLLADEINRTSPKTQSALLEVMEDGNVSVDGVTRRVPQPFLVIATQNPVGSAGTQLLPEAQMDRFIISLTLGYPDYNAELQMAQEADAHRRTDHLAKVLDRENFTLMQDAVHEVYMSDAVSKYIVNLVTATRQHPYLERGASPRATLSLVKMARASAWYEGRSFVTPADVAEQFKYVASHRVVRNAAARMEGRTVDEILTDVLQSVRKPPMEDKRR